MKRSKNILVGCFLLCIGSAANLAALAAPPAPQHDEIETCLQRFVDDKEVAGAVSVVASHDKILDISTVGYRDVEAAKAMDERTIFWIASMTKPITGVAIMILEEQAKLDLDDPVSKYLPEFKDLKDADGKPVTVTIKQLMTHSAGLSELSPAESAPLERLDQLTRIISHKPVLFPAGSKWQYSQTGINTAARIVEVVSQQNFPEFLHEHIFAPLKMVDTTFYLSEEQARRLAKSYRRTKEGKLEEAPLSILQGKSPTSRDRVPLANGGLFSTAPDYTRFCQMLLSGGTLDGATILKPETVKRFSSVHSGELQTGFTPGNAWGIGCCIVCEPQGVTADLEAGSYGHGGAYGTQAWIDPTRDRIYVLMVQRANFPNSDASPVRAAFQKAAQASAK
ncbi:MAG: serine hydrolase domain-containing protein [Aureliella sp.]